MAAKGNLLGSRLYDLLVVADEDLPAVARAFGAAAAEVADTDQTDTVAFTNGVVEAWQRFRNEYLALLSQSQGNAQDCATALVQVTNDYMAQDETAGEQLRGLMRENHVIHPDIWVPPEGSNDKFIPPKFDKPEYIDYTDHTEGPKHSQTA